jgi:hypothetical protein
MVHRNCVPAWLVVALLAAAPAAAQVGSIGVFSDAAGGDCNVVDVSGVVTTYVVLVGSGGAAYVWFALAESVGLQMTYLNETVHQPLFLGSTRSGIQIGFGACRSGAVHLLTVRYSGTGTTESCETIRVVPHPERPSGRVEVMDCTQTVHSVGQGAALVRNDGGCNCTTPVDDSSWGRVKALYR